MEKKSIIVCGATGKQGEAVVNSLLGMQGWNVIGLSRDPSGPRAEALKQKGVQILAADLLDKSSLIGAFNNAYGVFGVTQPWSADYKKVNAATELKQRRNIVDACLQTGIQHLVLSTVLHFDRALTGISHVDSKLRIEEYALEKKIPCTFLLPASFMENVGTNYFPIKNGAVRGYVDGDAKVPYIACRDIGVFAALAFDRPQEFIGKAIGLIGDFVSGEELCQTLSRIRKGETFKYRVIPRLIMKLFAREFYGMRVAFETWGRAPYPAEITEALDHCRVRHPQMMTVEDYLKSQEYDVKVL